MAKTEKGPVSDVAFFILLGFSPFLFQYALWAAFHRNVPWYIDLMAGIVFARITPRAAVLCLVATACGVPRPLGPALLDFFVTTARLMLTSGSP